MRKKFQKWMSCLLAFAMCMTMAPVSFAAGTVSYRAEEAWNLAAGQPTAASGVAENRGPENVVDGDKDTLWSSPDLKDFRVSNNSKDGEAQTPQWIRIDLGASGSEVREISIQYQRNKVWAMAYRIQTSDTPENENTWEDVAVVSRPSSNGFLVNGAGQNIANESTYKDTITTQTTPNLTKTTLKRYVRVWIEKTNAQASGGDNVNISEIEVMGTNADRRPAVDVSAVLNGISANDLRIVNGQVVLPETPAGAEVTVRGSEMERVIDNSGAVGGYNIGSRNVVLLLRAEETGNKENWAEKNVTITVPDHKTAYPAENNWFPNVKNANARPEVIPSIQEWYGYEGDFKLTADSRIVLKDAANVGLEKVAANMKEDVAEISGMTLEIVNGGEPRANDIYIESLTSDLYDAGEEGYVMVTNENGVHIYAPTYTGCLYGTITAEQILWQAADHVSIPKGIMRDYPAYEVRGIKLDVARTPYRYQQLEDYAKIMLWYKMNEYGLHINDNDNAKIVGATFETHSGFHRLESDTFPSLKSETKHAGIPQDLVNAEYYNENEDYQGNPTYTKEQWKDLTELGKTYGMHLLTEIDLPGHSLLYTKYAEENPDHIDWLEGGIMADASSTPGNSGYMELLDLIGENKERALRFGKELWEEYTDPADPTIYGDVVHIGSDEYWVHTDAAKEGFVLFADEMRKVIQKNLGADTKIRMWASGGSSMGMFANAKETLGMTDEELAQHYQLDYWSLDYDNAYQRLHEGYGLVNCQSSILYGNPGRRQRDVPNAEYLFNDWNPTIFGRNNPLRGEPNLLGAKAVIWGDQSQEGMTELDVHQRVLRSIAILSEKTWGGTAAEDTFSEYELRVGRLAEGPGTEIAMKTDSATSLVLDYDFHNLSKDGAAVYDASGNGYDASLTGGSISEDGWLAFDGNTLLKTPLKTVAYPYTVSFDLKVDNADNTKESSLFSGYDGRIQVAGHNGHMSADVNYFTRDFGYTVPKDGTVQKITIVGTAQAVRLYVDGQLVTFLSQKRDQDGVAAGNITTLYSSVLLPLEKIGQDFYGQMANLKVYNKAFSAEQVRNAYHGTEDGLVNVAQNANAGGKSFAGGNGDNGEQRTSTAMKAIDGEAFTSNDEASSEIYSYWAGSLGNSALTVDLGQTRKISRVDIQWRTGGIGNSFKIQTSDDGKNWADAKVISGNSAARQTIMLDRVAETRFLRMQGTQTNGNYKIQEFLAYENVEKTALKEKLNAMEDVMKEKALGFESEGAEKEAFQSVVFARAVVSSPLSTCADVEKAAAALDALTGKLEQAEIEKARQEAMQSAEKLLAAGQGDYSKETWDAFKKAYEDVKNAAADADIKALLGKLSAAQNALKKVQVPVEEPQKPAGHKAGDKVKEKNGNFLYLILDPQKKTAAVFQGLKKTSKNVKIPAKVELDGVSYTVTEVSANALKGYKKMTKLTIGANITKIGKQAFAGNKKLKKITVKSKVLKAVGKKAFKGIHAKCKIKVPKKKLKAYKKLLKKKGQKASVKITK